MTDQTFADGAFCAIFSTGGSVLWLRSAVNGRWELPGGAVESGETAQDACVREVFEETQIQITVETVELVKVYTVEERANRVSLFAADITEAEIALSVEHNDFVWADLTDVPGPMAVRWKQRAVDLRNWRE